MVHNVTSEDSAYEDSSTFIIPFSPHILDLLDVPISALRDVQNYTNINTSNNSESQVE